MSGLSLDPIWRQAVVDADQLFDYGDVISHQWLDEALGLKEPEDNVKAYKDYSLARVDLVSHFRPYLLMDCKKALKAVPGVGYEVVIPREQTDYSCDIFHKNLRKDFKKHNQLLVNVNVDMLTDEERARNSEELMKIAHLKIMVENGLRNSRTTTLNISVDAEDR